MHRGAGKEPKLMPAFDLLLRSSKCTNLLNLYECFEKYIKFLYIHIILQLADLECGEEGIQSDPVFMCNSREQKLLAVSY